MPPFEKNKYRKMRNQSPGFLMLAWVLAGIISLLFVGSIVGGFFTHSEEHALSLDVAPNPETTARLSAQTSYMTEAQNPEVTREIANKDTALAAIDMTSTQEEPSLDMPKVVTNLPNRASIETEKQALAAEGSAATIIRLDEMKAPEKTSQPLEAIPVIDLQESKTNTLITQGSPPPAPSPELVYQSAFGAHPKVSGQGLRPSAYYRRTSFVPADKPQLAVIISGLGLSTRLTEDAITSLPADITLSFAPYTKNLTQWAEQARKDGHELLLELPMEAGGISESDLGAASLTTTRTAKENLKRLEWLLSRFQGYMGVTNYLGTTLTRSPESIGPIYQYVARSGLAFFADSEMSLEQLKKSDIESVAIDMLISSNSANLQSQLDAVEATTLKKNTVIIKIYPTEETLPKIVKWINELAKQDIYLVPASKMID